MDIVDDKTQQQTPLSRLDVMDTYLVSWQGLGCALEPQHLAHYAMIQVLFDRLCTVLVSQVYWQSCALDFAQLSLQHPEPASAGKAQEPLLNWC